MDLDCFVSCSFAAYIFVEPVLMATQPYTTDTSSEAQQVQLELLRKMGPEKRVQKAIALSAEVARQCKAAIRRRHPNFDESEVGLKFIELNYGAQLAADVRQYLLAQKDES